MLHITHSLIINDKTMKENNLNDIIKNLKITINNNIFKHNLSDARNNWLGIHVNEVIYSVIIYFESLETVGV